ncbi:MULTISPECIES: GntR family transcriptional regulator [Thalassobaculum]|uniref:DNA-binding transcriptional regulator, GntR family n=1 Tax=Thalassobaculum litoreum DSM 18839 TaxID=1123362 RepID=A0A8G2BMU8_9PROT|nr:MULTISPECIES: GntR family transcriptional regulator [Thalassobaculum]SDG17003.1 DNA-binding transcriptional regulator, GntR family [Thalassobaculum litoreum DSM 18839]
MDRQDQNQVSAVPLGKSAKSLPAQLADIVLAEVMTGKLAPGDRLKEEALAQRHAVSRATVREALIELERQGYVVRIPRSGARVAEYSQADVSYIFEIRAALLGVAAGRCARLNDPAMLSELGRAVEDLERTAADDSADPQTFSNQSIRAQNLLVHYSGNQRLPELYERLAGMGTWQLIRGRAVSFLTAEDRRQSAADWRQLVEAVAQRSQQRAERAARQLLTHSAERVGSNLSRLGQEAPRDDISEDT